MNRTEFLKKELTKRAENGILNWDIEKFSWVNEPFPERIQRFLHEKCGIILANNNDRAKLRDSIKTRAKELEIKERKLKDLIGRYFCDLIIEDDDNDTEHYSTEYCPAPDPSNSKSRANAFLLAALLNLDLVQTEAFLQVVFRMHTFDLKNRTEVLYYWFLQNDVSDWYNKSNKLNEDIKVQLRTVNPALMLDDFFSKNIENSLNTITSQDQLKNYILTNQDLFDESKRSLTARREIKELAKVSQKLANYEHYSNSRIQWPVKKDVAKLFEDEKYKHQQTEVTPNHLLSTILFTNVRENTDKLPGFPTHGYLNNVMQNKYVSDDFLRKLIIILCFYCYIKAYEYSEELETNMFIEENSDITYLERINFSLNRCGYNELYIYDEFDLLFLFALENKEPVEALRHVIQKKIHSLGG